MNAERLHAIANAIRNDLQTTKAINLLQELSKALQNQINSTQEPTHQTQLAENLKSFMRSFPCFQKSQQAVVPASRLDQSLLLSYRSFWALQFRLRRVLLWQLSASSPFINNYLRSESFRMICGNRKCRTRT